MPLAEQYALAERMVQIFRDKPDPLSWWVRETLRLIREDRGR